MVHDEHDTDSEREVFNRLLLTSSLIADDMTLGLQERGLTQARATALWQVARRGPLNQRQLADLLKVTPRNVTTLVDALERTGFIARTDDEGDRRAVLVRLTGKGEAAAARMESEGAALAHELFGDLAPADLATFLRVLDHVAARFVRDDGRDDGSRRPGNPVA
jgi:DNA-binding MarR family transcriptional regulator